MNKPIRDVQVTVPVLGPGTANCRAPLMPCHPARARQLIKKKGAKSKWFKGIYSIQLDHPSSKNLQKIICGLDTGIFREAFTIQSSSHTYLNVLSDGINHIHKKLKIRKYKRQFRRKRKTPCRTPRFHRRPKKNWIAPSIKARWEARLRIARFIKSLYPVTDYVIEDVAARKFVKMRKWNKLFSNLELGKTDYYNKFFSMGNLVLKKGYETSKYREELGFKKIKSKLSESFYSHNIDSWVLASFVSGKKIVDNENVFRMISLKPYRRQLYLHNFQKGHFRKKYGGTISLGFKKGSFVRHKQYGLLMIGGASDKGLSLHNPNSGIIERFNGIPEEYEFLYYSGWRTYWINNIVNVPKTEFIGGHSLRDPNVREKAKKTKEKLYGNANFTNREKAKQTCLKKYGVSNPNQCKEVVEKRLKTSLSRYGKIFNYVRPPTFTKEQLVDLHINRKLTLKEIGKRFSLTPESVSFWMKRYNISVQRRHRYHVDKEKSSIDTKEYNIPQAVELFVSLSKIRGVSRDAYKDGVLKVPTHVLERTFGGWNRFIQICGLNPVYTANDPTVYIKDYFEACMSKNEVLSFYEFEKVTNMPRSRLKRLFEKGKKYHHLKDELFAVALYPEKQKEFLKKV